MKVRYEVRFVDRAKDPKDRGIPVAHNLNETQIRRATRYANLILRETRLETKRQVTIRSFGPGRPARGRVEYQAHVGKRRTAKGFRKIVVVTEER